MPAARATPDQLSIVDGLAQLSFLIQGLLEQRASEFDLSIPQTRLLGVLRDRTPSMNELAHVLGLDKSSVTGLVGRAERRGMVIREASPSDGRAVIVSLTDLGRTLTAQVSAGFDTDVKALLAGLPAAERKTLSGLVSRLLTRDARQRGIDLFPSADEPLRPSASYID